MRNAPFIVIKAGLFSLEWATDWRLVFIGANLRGQTIPFGASSNYCRHARNNFCGYQEGKGKLEGDPVQKHDVVSTGCVCVDDDRCKGRESWIAKEC